MTTMQNYKLRRNNRKCILEQLERREVFSIAVLDGSRQMGLPEVKDDAFVVKLNSSENVLSPLDNDGGFLFYPMSPEQSVGTIDLRTINTSGELVPAIFPPPRNIAERLLQVTQAEHGRVEIAADGRTVKYTPNSGFEGVDRFTYIASGFDAPRNSGTVFINVVQPLLGMEDWFHAAPGREVNLDVLKNERVNAAPFQYAPAPITIASADAVISSVDSGEFQRGLRITEVSTPNAGGSVRIASDGRSIVYSSSATFSGVERLVYQFVDRDGYHGQATVVIRVSNQLHPNDDPHSLWPEQIDQLRREQIIEANAYSLGMGDHYDFYPLPFSDFALVPELQPQRIANSRLRADSLSAEVRSSDTNNQIAGVDEGDLVENDGRYLYVFSNSNDVNELVIIDTLQPVEPVVVSRTPFIGTLIGQHLLGNRLAVITSRYVEGKATTKLTLLDIADRTQPKIARATEVDSDYQQSRVIGDKLYLFSQRAQQISQTESSAPSETSHIKFNETGRQLLARLANELFIDALPVTTNYDSSGAVLSRSVNSAASAVIVRSEYWAPLQIINSFDLDSEDVGPIDADIFASQYGATLFVSTTSAYFFENDWHGATQTTKINRYLFDSVDGSVDWAATGSVPGGLLNSFSAGEYQGNLQVATSDWSSGNYVTILAQDGTNLKRIGSIENLAPGELLYSARFMGDQAFIVTFRTVDPLYVLDLSDAANPKVAGELKLPGYSQYLQMIDETHLLGIGRDADAENGQYAGLQVTLFDVSDVSHPKVASQYLFDGGRTTFSAFAENNIRSLSDHHAISYFPESGILALPVYSIQYGFLSENDEPIFADPSASQISVLKIDPQKGIHSLGNVPFPNRASRSVRIENRLYSISPDRVIVTELSKPETKLAEVYYGQGATNDVVQVPSGGTLTVKVLANDGFKGHAERGRVTSYRNSSDQISVTLGDDGKSLSVTTASKVAGVHEVEYSVEGPEGIRTSGTLLVETPWVWHNDNQPMDVDGNGTISALDVLQIVNLLNQHSAQSTDNMEDAIFSPQRAASRTRPMLHADVNEDSSISALDVLLIVNHINQRFVAAGENNVAVDYSVYDELFADESAF